MSAENISDAEMLMDIGIDHKTDLTLEWEEQKIIIDELARLRAELDEAREDEKILRHLLWLRHGCDMLYGDDGERQCGHCRIDFNRDTPAMINERWEQMGQEQMRQAAALAPAASGEQKPIKYINLFLCPKCGAKTDTYRHPHAKVWCTVCGYILRAEGDQTIQHLSSAPAAKEEQ